jgi:hypothetical protein
MLDHSNVARPAHDRVRDPATQARPRATRQTGEAAWPRVVTVLVLVAIGVYARRPGYLLSHPFWFDEGWVADSVRAPLGQLRMVTSSTPIGWTLLLRVVPPLGGPERYRLLPLAFGAAGTVPAWLLGRQLGGVAGWLAAPLAGLAAALGPAALFRPGLKQFSTEAFITLLLMWVLATVERTGSPRRLLLFGLVAAACFLVANAAVFVAAAALIGLALSSLLRRAWRSLAWVALTAAGVVTVQLTIYLVVVAPANSTAMRAYWTRLFIPTDQGLDGAVAVVGARGARFLTFLGLGPWPVVLGLVLAGVAALARARLPATAMVTPLLLVELISAGLAGRYPFLDPRTSQFFLVLVTVVATIGLAALAGLLAQRNWTVVVVAALLLMCGASFVPASARATHGSIPDENVRGQIQLVLSGRRFGDVVLVTSGAANTFGYYWPTPPTFVDRPTFGTVTFQVDYPEQPDLVVATGRDRASDLEALSRVPAGARRVWIVVGHERLETWARLAERFGHLVAAASDPCRPFTPAARVRARVSARQCPLLVELRPSGHLARPVAQPQEMSGTARATPGPQLPAAPQPGRDVPS